jgi:hypothetical protein
MSVTISGDTGLAGAATGALNGTLGATTPSTVVATTISGTDLTTTGNTILGNASTDTLNVGNGDLVKDASGNLGVGTASPAVRCDIYGEGGTLDAVNPPLQVVSTTALAANVGGGIAFGGNYSGSLKTTWAGIAGLKENATSGQYGGYLAFYTRPHGDADTERMRIDSSGDLQLGAANGALTVGTKFFGGVNTNGSNAYGVLPEADGNSAPKIYSRVASTAARTHTSFLNGNGEVGQISTNGTATSFVTSSDYRLKDNVLPMGGALDKIAQLKPVTYTWKIDGSNGQGFIAHELQSIMPDCVIGEKDAVDVDGKPVYQGIDTSFLVATLTAAIQEQQALITSLTARLEVLEAK